MNQSQAEKIKELEEKVKIKELEEKLDTGPLSEKQWFILFICWFLFGFFGVHRFYAGKIGTGIIWLFTGACLGIGWIVDFIKIVMGNFRDSKDRKIKW